MLKRVAISAMGGLFAIAVFAQTVTRPHPDYHPTNVHPWASTSAPTSSLMNQLVAYWNLDEQSGTRVKTAGSCASCDLTAVNAPGARGGAGGYSGNATTASSQYFTLADNSFISGDGSQTLEAACWVMPTVVGAANIFLDKNTEYALLQNQPQIKYMVTSSTTAISLETPVANKRVLVYGKFSATNSVGINGDALVSIASSPVADGTSPLVIGAYGGGVPAYGWNGSIGPCMLWKRSSGGISHTDLHNSGKGYSCANLPAALRTNLVACWDLDEASGTRVNESYTSCGSACDLTAVNAPTRTAGLVETGMGMGAQMLATSSSYLSVADQPEFSFTTKLSATFWVNPQGLNTNQAYLGKWNYQTDGGWAIQSYDLDPARLTVFLATSAADNGTGSKNYFGGTALLDKSWRHISVQYDGTQTGNANRLKAWVNGVQETLTVTSGAVPATLRDDAASLLVGNFGGTLSNRYANAVMDGPMLHSRNLTESEIQALYAAGAGVEYPWSSILALLNLSGPTTSWASLTTQEKQMALWGKYRVFVPEYMIPSHAMEN